jgi:TetR/AcrR family acrAB operon transcriptional repressor
VRRTKEEALQTRQDLLDAALAVFSEKGFHATRLQDVAAAAGTTRGAIYHHFQNKADLYRTLVQEAAEQGNRAVLQAVEAGGSFSEICTRILVLSAQMLVEDKRFRQIAALSLYKTGASPELEQIEAMRVEQARQTVQGVATYMQLGIDSGDLRDDLDAETIARAFLALQNGIAWLWLANGEFFSIRKDAAPLAKILLGGIGKEQG